MKNLTLVTAALVAVGLVSSASAQSVVRITGSTAYRANVNKALKAGTGIFDATPTVVGTAYADGANALVFKGTIGGTANQVVIKTSFTGSEAGIAALANVAIDDSVSGQPAANLPGTPQPTFLDTATGLTLNDTAVPDIAMADTSQRVSLTQGHGVTDKGIVGVVQFVWMKGKNNGQNGWSDLVNVTSAGASVLLGTGQQDLSFVTGLNADVGTPVVVVGRNKGSGTRVNTLTELNYGVGTAVHQYAVSPTYTAGVLNKPASTVNINDAAITAIGNDGYDSGGGVANIMAMTRTTGTLTTIPIGALGLNDANGVSGQALTGTGFSTSAPNGGTSQYLSLNGVIYSDQNIENGSYDFWGHEHLLTGTNVIVNTIGNTVANSLVSQIAAQATGGLLGIPYITSGVNQTMFVDRPSGQDTGPVTPL